MEITFGRREEWKDFELRNRLFLEKFPELEAAMNSFVSTPVRTTSQAGTVIWGLSRLCLEDAMEILLLAGNGYGVGAQKLLRGMYERAVTARYLSLNPTRADDFVEFGKASRYKMVEPIRRTVGKKLIPKDVVAELKSSRDSFSRRNQPRTIGARLRLWSTNSWGGALELPDAGPPR